MKPPTPGSPAAAPRGTLAVESGIKSPISEPSGPAEGPGGRAGAHTDPETAGGSERPAESVRARQVPGTLDGRSGALRAGRPESRNGDAASFSSPVSGPPSPSAPVPSAGVSAADSPDFRPPRARFPPPPARQRMCYTHRLRLARRPIFLNSRPAGRPPSSADPPAPPPPDTCLRSTPNDSTI
jgi:hypothetical protein